MSGSWNTLVTARTIVDKIILAISFLLAIASSTLWMPIKEQFGLSIYYIGTALAVFGYSVVLWRKYKNTWTELILAGTTNVLVDELFFDPTKFEINEYILFTLCILWTLRKKLNLKK